MIIREPAVAGQFYPAQPQKCRQEVARLFDAAGEAYASGTSLVAGLAPHAGWAYSGAVAAGVFKAMAASRGAEAPPDVIVLFGGVHRHRSGETALFAGGRWETPVGPVEVDARLAERILGHTNLIADDPYAHESEHSLEVQLPLLLHLFPKAKIVPLMVPPMPTAAEVGRSVAGTLKAYDYNAIVVGTTDLTHYGPNYGFVGHGLGDEGNRWAKQENDARFIELLRTLAYDELVPEAARHRNACSSGAAAATVAAAVALGAKQATVLEHTNSAEVAASMSAGAQDNSVGYVGMVFG